MGNNKYFIEPFYELHVYDDKIEIISNSKRHKGQPMSQVNCDNYKCVQLAGKMRKVHQLVTFCVHGPRPEGMVINHKDSNTFNNHPSNLEYCTPQENVLHAARKGRLRKQDGELNSMSKLTEKDVLEIRELRETTDLSLVQLGAKYNVCFQLISKVVNRKIWKHI